MHDACLHFCISFEHHWFGQSNQNVHQFNTIIIKGAYLLLMRFFESIRLLRQSSLYKEEKTYVDSLIDMNKLSRTLELLEGLKASLVKRYTALEDKKKLSEVATKVVVPDKAAVTLADKKFLSPTELKSHISSSSYKFLLIDVRSQSEFEGSHINLSILLSGR